MAIISSKKQPQPQEPDKEPHRKKAAKKNTDDKLLQPQAAIDDIDNSEVGIRPQQFADYIGQKDLKDVLDIAIKAAKSRGEVLDHLLLYGPPGLGKTT
ncbi:MAG: Holliday junction branch migration DNA helicase RuvB, partial [Cyanobacteria bacterium J06649_11]